MGKRINRVLKSNPGLEGREDVASVAEDTDKYAAIAAVSNTEGGKELLKALRQDIVSAIESIVSGYRNLPEMELRALAATLEARIQVSRMLNRAKTNLQLAEEVLNELTG